MEPLTTPETGSRVQHDANNSQWQRELAVTDSRPTMPKIRSTRLNFHYGSFQALHDISLDIHENRVTAFIGPSGCGKSTFLRTLNRMHEMVKNTKVEGELLLDGGSIFDLEVSQLRRRVGMVFQKSNPFPKSIFDNVAYGLQINGMARGSALRDAVESSLRRAALWNEVKDKLDQSGSGLSGGQQQRLCIARGIAIKPEVLLLDEPCSALDPISTGKIEELITELKSDYTVVIVTHNMQQAARCSDYTAYMYLGDLVEFGRTADLFMKPKRKDTEDYITGRFG